MTQTAAEADILLPATSCAEHEGVYSAADRGFQRFYKAVEPTGDVKDDWVIISEIATAMATQCTITIPKKFGMNFVHFAQLYQGQPTKNGRHGLSNGHVLMRDPEDQGTQYLYKGQIFDRPNGKAGVLCLRLGTTNGRSL